MYILYEVADKIATITLNRPEPANAQNAALLDELDAAWTRAADDPEVSVIVLRAEGKHFSSGHDLQGGGPVPDKITLEMIYQTETPPVPRVLAAVAQHSQAVDRGGPGQVHRGRSAAVLAVRPDRRGGGRLVLRPGGADGHRRGRVPRPHLGTRPAQGQGDPVHRPPGDRRRRRSRSAWSTRWCRGTDLDAEIAKLAEQIAQMPPFGLRQAKRAVNQTLDVQGFYAAIQSVFDIHQTGHGNALSVGG